MLKNYLLLAFRNLQKRKIFSIINIFGLALGIAACLVILKYIDFETSYDNFFRNSNHLFRVNRLLYQNGEKLFGGYNTSYGLGPAMQASLPEIRRYIRVHPMYGGSVISYQPPTGDIVAFHEDNALMVDSTFLRAFDFPAIEGNPSLALDQPYSIVITEQTAKRYFGNDDPMGKSLNLTGGWLTGNYIVTAVLKNIPENSSFNFNILVPLHNVLLRDQYRNDDGWDWNNFITYVETNPKASRL